MDVRERGRKRWGFRHRGDIYSFVLQETHNISVRYICPEEWYMCTYVFMHVGVCVCVCIYIQHTHTHTHTHTDTHTLTHTHPRLSFTLRHTYTIYRGTYSLSLRGTASFLFLKKTQGENEVPKHLLGAPSSVRIADEHNVRTSDSSAFFHELDQAPARACKANRWPLLSPFPPLFKPRVIRNDHLHSRERKGGRAGFAGTLLYEPPPRPSAATASPAPPAPPAPPADTAACTPKTPCDESTLSDCRRGTHIVCSPCPGT